jgi:hypothetical protein
MGNDIAAPRAAIGLLYCQINGISHKHELLSPFVSGMFSAICVNIFRNMLVKNKKDVSNSVIC